MIYFTAHTFKCVCHCRRAMFRVLGMYNFGNDIKKIQRNSQLQNGASTIMPSLIQVMEHS